MHFTLRVNQLLFARCASESTAFIPRMFFTKTAGICWNHDALSRIRASGWVQMRDVVQRGQAASRGFLLQFLLMRSTIIKLVTGS